MTKDIKKNQETNDLNNEVSCGKLLSSERQAKDLSIKDVARELRIDSSIIKKLENNEFQLIEAPVFVKGYLRQYAGLLGLKIDMVIDSYEKNHPDQSYKPIVNEAEEQIRKYVLTPKLIFIATSVLVIFLMGWVIFSTLPQDNPLPAISNNQAVYEEPNPVVEEIVEEEIIESASEIDEPEIIEPNPVVEEIVEEEIIESASEIDEPEIIEPNPVVEEVVEEEIIEPASEIDEPEIIEPNPVVEEIAEVKLKVNYNGACWTEIYDAFGNVLFYDLGNNDQDVIVSGVAPLDVLFGAIDQVNNIKVDDQDFALPITSRRGSVLRFEIATLE
jgi:cytoskeleton protein RodZ